MFFRLFLCVLLFASAVSAQPRRFTPNTPKTPRVKVAVSPDGLTIAVARGSGGTVNRFGRVELWNSTTGELQRTITGFDGPIWSMAFSRDGKSIVTVSTEYREKKIQHSVRDREEKVFAELKWWDAQSGEFIKKVSLANEGVDSVEAAWSPNGDVLALVERYSERQLTQVSDRGAFGQRIVIPGWVNVDEVDLKLLDAQTGQRRVKVEDVSRTYQGYHALLYARLEHPVFSPDGKILAAVLGQEVTLWSVD
jgi:WD40 repeat protein